MRTEVVVIDNNSVEPATHDYFAEAGAAHRELGAVLPAPVPFNWSHLNNAGAAAVEADAGLPQQRHRGDFAGLAAAPGRERAAPTGRRLRAAVAVRGRTIQHAGVVVGMGGWADHVCPRAIIRSIGRICSYRRCCGATCWR